MIICFKIIFVYKKKMYIRGGEVYDDEEIFNIYENENDSDYLEKDDYELSFDDIISIIFLDRMNINKITLSC